MVAALVLSSLLHFPLMKVLAKSPSSVPAIAPWGFDLTGMEQTVKPGDDFFLYANGNWVKNTPIPDDQSTVSTFSQLQGKTNAQLKTILEDAASDRKAVKGSNRQKIGDWYASFMDEAQIEKLGIFVLQPDFNRIAEIKTPADLAKVLGENNGKRLKLNETPITVDVAQDMKDSSQTALILGVSGLSLDSTDFYLNPEQEALRTQHKTHIQRMLTLAGISDADIKAQRVQALETKLAQAESLTSSEQYVSTPTAELSHLYPDLDWQAYLTGADITDQTRVVVASPSVLEAATKLVQKESLDSWKDYLTYNLLRRAAIYLPRAFREEHFAFYAKTLQGQPQPSPRWQQAITDIQYTITDALSEAYVDRYFQPESKAAAEVMMDDMMAAFDTRLANLSWMTAATREEARAKLAKMKLKVGYPDSWIDYASLDVVRGDAISNLKRADQFLRSRSLAQLGKPVDRNLWDSNLPPFFVGAVPNPLNNEIIIPAAMLQPPFFDPEADPAVNYGGVGAVITHEITHLFDTIGSLFDGDGNMRNWWEKEDTEQFTALTQALVTQASSYEVLPGKYLDGKATLTENIADIGGIFIAYDGYQRFLQGKPAPVLDGFTGDQRFFLAWANLWRRNSRETAKATNLITDIHSPVQIRTFMVRNHPAWYKAFNVQPEDKLYLLEKERIMIW
jgi:putative endopeptidase